MVYESIRSYFTPVGDKNPVWYRKLAAGAISGAVAQTCTYPLYVVPYDMSFSSLTLISDVLRRRFQINSMPGMGNQYTSIPHAIRTILLKEGFLGLYKGIVPNLLKVAPSMASSWLSFELTRDFLLSLNPDDNRGEA